MRPESGKWKWGQSTLKSFLILSFIFQSTIFALKVAYKRTTTFYFYELPFSEKIRSSVYPAPSGAALPARRR
ncbi:hypothetical protein, partial [Akkermansia sp.]|uniref:hypothetical protein n=1 Tax=Akkermansia sp. TaxID=1872421 RepID=UPI002586A86E